MLLRQPLLLGTILTDIRIPVPVRMLPLFIW
jgi:hypothetical protein